MEGSYNQLRKAQEDVPHEAFKPFLKRLLSSVSDDMADCFQTAYESWPVVKLRKTLQLSLVELKDIGKERWRRVSVD